MKQKVKVLVVDDDRRMIKTMSDILRFKGFEPTQAYCGEEAVARVKEDGLDCVLMDLKMPGIDGVETLRLIQAASPDLPVVLMSAFATREQVREVKRLGAYTVLTKPIDIQLVLKFLSLLRKEESILVVDDDPAFCRTIKNILEGKGFRVETEMDFANVLDHMERNYKLVVLLDLKLDQANGIEILREIRAKYPTKPVILVTAYGREMLASIKQGEEIGAYTCLYKPLEIENLIEILEEISRRKRQALLGVPFDGRAMIGG
jgi:DNA-binding NtrC family response regulator